MYMSNDTSIALNGSTVICRVLAGFADTWNADVTISKRIIASGYEVCLMIYNDLFVGVFTVWA